MTRTKEQKYDELMAEIQRLYDQLKEGAMMIPESRDKQGRLVKGMKVPRTQTVRLACDLLEKLMRVGSDKPEPQMQLKLNVMTESKRVTQ